jgi:type II secretory pathway component PulK
VLAALIDSSTDFGDAELLASNRKDGCYPTTEFVKNLVSDPQARQALAKEISESSDWFRAVTAVRIGTSEFTLYSLIERNGGTQIRTVTRSTGTE